MHTPHGLSSLVPSVSRFWQRPALRQWMARIRWWAERALEKAAEGG